MTIYKYDHLALGTILCCSKFKVAGLLRLIFLHLKLLLLVSRDVKNNGSNPDKHRLKMKRKKKKHEEVRKLSERYLGRIRGDLMYCIHSLSL